MYYTLCNAPQRNSIAFLDSVHALNQDELMETLDILYHLLNIKTSTWDIVL